MTTIKQSSSLVNIVVAFDGEGGKRPTPAQALAGLEAFKGHKGFVGATLLENPDSGKTVSILQWESLEDHYNCLKHPSWQQSGLPCPKPSLEPLPYRVLAEIDATATTVCGYVTAWTTGNLEAAKAALAPNVVFEGPNDRLTSADQLINAVGGFLKIFKGITPVAKVVDGDSAFVLYDCALATPLGKLRCAEYFKVSQGKITEIKLVYDATELNKLQGK